MKIKTLLLFLFAGTCCLAQETVYLTVNDSVKQKGERHVFSQAAISLPFRANPAGGGNNEFNQQKEFWFIPDGITAHVGFGVHYHSWAGVSLNTGIDWKISDKLVAVPVYASLILNPKVSDDVGILVQAGLGKAFAIGRGSLSGTYKKIRLGITNDEYSLFLDASTYGFDLRKESMGSISIGVAVFNFL